MTTEPNTITFHNINTDWVMRITADRRIEVNEDVEVTEAAQKVLDALQNLLKPPKTEQESFSPEAISATQAAWKMGYDAAKAEQEPVAWYHDDFGTLELSRIQRVGWKPLYAARPQRTEQNFCPRCGKRTQDIHTCTPPQEKNT